MQSRTKPSNILPSTYISPFKLQRRWRRSSLTHTAWNYKSADHFKMVNFLDKHKSTSPLILVTDFKHSLWCAYMKAQDKCNTCLTSGVEFSSVSTFCTSRTSAATNECDSFAAAEMWMSFDCRVASRPDDVFSLGNMGAKIQLCLLSSFFLSLSHIYTHMFKWLLGLHEPNMEKKKNQGSCRQ